MKTKRKWTRFTRKEASHGDDDDEDEDEDDEEKSESYDMSDDIKTLVGGEDLSEEFKTKQKQFSRCCICKS